MFKTSGNVGHHSQKGISEITWDCKNILFGTNLGSYSTLHFYSHSMLRPYIHLAFTQLSRQLSEAKILQILHYSSAG